MRVFFVFILPLALSVMATLYCATGIVYSAWRTALPQAQVEQLIPLVYIWTAATAFFFGLTIWISWKLYRHDKAAKAAEQTK